MKLNDLGINDQVWRLKFRRALGSQTLSGLRVFPLGILVGVQGVVRQVRFDDFCLFEFFDQHLFDNLIFRECLVQNQ